ncbi:MAG: SMP-30/gluconolactonase/LRE family protein [Myxococcales bacterium]
MSANDTGNDVGVTRDAAAVDGAAVDGALRADAATYFPFQLGTPHLIKGGFAFTEGPVWDLATNTLLFSDIEADTIYKLDLPSTVTVFRTPSSHFNGLGLDTNGLLIAAEYSSRSIARTTANGTIQPLADIYQGKRFNSPNDLTVRSDGTIYFTDPTFGLQGTSEVGIQGVYRISPAGPLTLEADSDKSPNGVALSPDENTLYVAITFENRILAFDVATDGATRNPRSFASVQEPDGICVAPLGRLYVAAKNNGAGALVVLDSTGASVAVVPITDGPTNCEFGGVAAKTLFITARVPKTRN